MTASFKNPEDYLIYMGRWSRRLAFPYLEFCEIQQGDFLLDAGTGTGALPEALHETKPGCRLMGIDISESYVEHAQRYFSFPNFEFKIGSILEIPAETDTFDKSLSLLVLNLIDPKKAVLEMKRVTKPGGLVTSAIWDFSGGMGMLDLFRRAVQVADPGGGPKSTAGAYLGQPGAMRALWEEIGFNDVQDAALEISTNFKNFDDFWNPFLAGATPYSVYVRSLTEEKRNALKNYLLENLLPDGTDRPFSLPARAWGVKGRKPY